MHTSTDCGYSCNMKNVVDLQCARVLLLCNRCFFPRDTIRWLNLETVDTANQQLMMACDMQNWFSCNTTIVRWLSRPSLNRLAHRALEDSFWIIVGCGKRDGRISCNEGCIHPLFIVRNFGIHQDTAWKDPLSNAVQGETMSSLIQMAEPYTVVYTKVSLIHGLHVVHYQLNTSMEQHGVLRDSHHSNPWSDGTCEIMIYA